jgi:hypothetical protein
MKYSLQYGSDPELFATYKDGDREFVYPPSALEKFDGVKRLGGDDKHPVFIENADYRIIMDGVAFEINLKQPHHNLKVFYEMLQTASEHLEDFLGKYGYNVVRKPVVAFDYNRFWTKELSKDATFMQGIIFGCDPDKDAFNVDWLATVLDVAQHPFRYGGGHIHISGDEDISKYPLPFVRLLAVTVGNFCILNSPHPELEQMRAKYYGKPGKYRIQQYPNGTEGVEYRTPSNSWLNYPFEKFEEIFEQVDIALDYLKNPVKGKEVLNSFAEVTVEAITKANRDLSLSVLNQLK